LFFLVKQDKFSRSHIKWKNVNLVPEYKRDRRRNTSHGQCHWELESALWSHESNAKGYFI